MLNPRDKHGTTSFPIKLAWN